MKKFQCIVIGFLLFSSCNIGTSQSAIHPVLVDKIHIGMTIQEMKSIYNKAEFINEPLYEYGIDSEEKGIMVKVNGEALFFVWTMQGNDTIHGIAIVSKKIFIDKDVHVGMTLEDFHNKYPKSKLAIDELTLDYEYIHIPVPDYRVEFLTTDSTRAADYDYSKSEPEFISIKRPKTVIDRISL
jgi:hypothetical protein